MAELCKKCSVTKDTVRYYHKKDLLKKPMVNSKNGYGIYDYSHKERIRFIKKLQSFGFSLKEIKRAIDLEESNQLTDEERLITLHKKLEDVDLKLDQLNEYKQTIIKAIRYLS